MTISEALDWAANVFAENGVEGPKSSARLLLQQIFEKDLAFLFTFPDQSLTNIQEKRFCDWVGRRAKHEPVWYIADNQIKFYGQKFYVDQNVLIPRPETELLIERILSDLGKRKSEKISIVDIGTGSGSIILSLGSSLRGVSDDAAISFSASDISAKALGVAKKNAKAFGLNNAVDFERGNLFEPWEGQSFDLIITNLPYIPHEDLPFLDKDVIQYEPLAALDGGKEGLEVYQEFFNTIGSHLNTGAHIYCEIGHNQGTKIMEMAVKKLPKSRISLIKDYANKDRIVIIET